MDLRRAQPTEPSPTLDGETVAPEVVEGTISDEPRIVLDRAQARDRRWRELRSRRLQRCIDGFRRIEWLGYAITEPLILWSYPVLFVGLCGVGYWIERHALAALSWGSTLALLIVALTGLLGWAIRGIGHGLRKLSLHWGDEQAIQVRDLGDPGA